MNKMMRNGLSSDYTVINVWDNKSNGNGLYLAMNSIGNTRLVIVYNDGYMTDWITVYDNNTFSTDRGIVTKTMRNNINKAIRFTSKYGFTL